MIKLYHLSSDSMTKVYDTHKTPLKVVLLNFYLPTSISYEHTCVSHIDNNVNNNNTVNAQLQ